MLMDKAMIMLLNKGLETQESTPIAVCERDIKNQAYAMYIVSRRNLRVVLNSPFAEDENTSSIYIIEKQSKQKKQKKKLKYVTLKM